MSTNANKAALHRARERWNAGDLAGYLALYDARAVVHGYPGVEPGIASITRFYTGFTAAFPDARLTFDDLITEGDEVAVRFVMEGTQEGPLMGVPPTGKRVRLSGITILRFAGGKCVERWSQADFLGLLRQLGAIPGPASADGPASGPPAAQAAGGGRVTSPAENKALDRRYVEEVLNRGNLAVIDELVAPDFVDHANPPGMAHGPDGMKAVLALFRAGFPDFHVTIEDQVAEGDRVARRIAARGTHRGAFFGIPPTGTAVAFTGIHVVRFGDGKMAEHWATNDDLGLMQQLGVIPAPGQAPA